MQAHEHPRKARRPRRATGTRSVAALHVEPLEARDLLCNTISGFVYHDANNNGRFDPGEAPLANTALELRNAQNVVVATAVTNAQGFYQFERDATISTAARTVSHSVTFPATPTDWDLSRTVARFNPALGTLTAVDVVYNGSITSHIRAESLDTAPRRITATVAGTITLSGPGLPATVSNLSAQRFFDAAAYDGILDFRGASGVDFGPQTAPGSRTVRLTDAGALAPYAGAGTVTFNVVADANASATAGGNVVSQINTTAQAEVTVTYTYTPDNCLRPGNYTIVQRQPDGFLDGKDARDVEVLGGSVGADAIPVTLTDRGLPNNNFGEIRPSSLHGCVYVDANNNGLREGGEAPLTNITIRLAGGDELGAVERTTTTGTDGCYRFSLLRPGSYAVFETQAVGYFDGKDTLGSLGGTAANDRLGDIALGQGVDGVNYNFGELPPSSLAGCVYWDVNDNGVKEDGEQELAGVRVTLAGTDDLGAAVSVAQDTDARGCYLFQPLRPGIYRITESQPVGYLSGKNSLGTAGGATVGDEFQDIRLPAGAAGVRYNFGELRPLERPGPGYERTFSHTRLIVPGPRDVNLLSKLQFLTTPGQRPLDAATLANVIYIEGLYRTLLHRESDLAGLRTWVGQLQAGANRAQVVQAIWNSLEHRGIQVDNLFATFLRRTPDAAGRQVFVNGLLNGMSEVDVARIFLNSGEFQAAHAGSTAFASALYVRVLGRTPDAAGLQTWARALDTGFTRSQMVDVFLNSREAFGRVVDGVYDNYLYRTPEPTGREAWLSAMQRGQATPQAFSIAVLASEEAFDKARRSART